jgi:RNA recognition motif-containing protein
MGNRIYVGNLSFHTNEESIRAAFAEVGEVTEVHVVLDRVSGQSRGFGFVTMATSEAATQAIARLNGAIVDGRPLRVNEAEERPQRTGGGGFSQSGGGQGRGEQRKRW